MAVSVSRKSRRNERNDRPTALLSALRVALLPRTRIDALSGDPNFMTSLARGLSVIQCFSHATSFLTVSQISQSTGFSRASVRRCLYTLSKLGLANSEDGTHYALLPRVLTLGHSYIFSMPLSKVAQPVLDRLSQVLRESCSIAMLDGTDVIHVAHANISRVLAVDLSMGSRLPAIYTSMGRVLLAHLPAQGSGSASCACRIYSPHQTLHHGRKRSASGAPSCPARWLCFSGSGTGDGIVRPGCSPSQCGGKSDCRAERRSARAACLGARLCDQVRSPSSGGRTGTLDALEVMAWPDAHPTVAGEAIAGPLSSQLPVCRVRCRFPQADINSSRGRRL